MAKVFLYLYPIEEFTKMFLFHNDTRYDEIGRERPLPVLNETIDKRYRQKEYQVVYALYPDKKMFGIEPQETDKTIYTDITFADASAYNEKGEEKKDFIPKYPSEEKLISQLGEVEQLVVGGYHFSDCVRRVAEYALNKGIDTLVDIDMTDLFFNVYLEKDYFEMDNYSPERYRKHMINKWDPEDADFGEMLFDKHYASPVYGFNNDSDEKLKQRGE